VRPGLIGVAGPYLANPERGRSGGYSLLELVFVMTLSITVSAAAVPQYLSGLDDTRATAATRYVAARLQRARMDAVTRSASVAIQFSSLSTGYAFGVYADGNRNGVLTYDIQHGVDRPLGAVEHLSDQFPGVDFGVLPGLPAIDSGSSPPGSDPIHLGSGSLASFSSAGTSSSGTLYLRSRGGAQFAIRIFGETGRTRLLKFDRNSWVWRPL
jgi:type II secretory pathway pseudopilin PulG